MLYEGDEKGRYKLKSEEYQALLELCASFTLMKDAEGCLKERMRLGSNMWRDYRCMVTMLDKLIGNILDTVPLKKLRIIQQDIKNVRMQLYSGAVSGARSKPWVVSVDDEALMCCLDEVMSHNCMLCDKTKQEYKKCPYHKMLSDLFPYEPDADTAGGECPLAGRDTIRHL